MAAGTFLPGEGQVGVGGSKLMSSLFSQDGLAAVPRKLQDSDFLRRAPRHVSEDMEEEEKQPGDIERLPLEGGGPRDSSESLESSNPEPSAVLPDEERIRAGARRAAETDMTPADWEKYSRLRGGDLLDPAQAAADQSIRRRYHRPERFEGAMESSSDSRHLGTSELFAHVRNRSRAFRPEDGGRSIFESKLDSARKARQRLKRPVVEGDRFDEERDTAERSHAESLNWLGSDRADKGALVPGFRAKGSVERPYLTELIPQQYTYQRSENDQALPVGPMGALQAQENAHRVLMGQRDHQDSSLASGYNADRTQLESQVTAARSARDEARDRTLGVKWWNPISWIAGIGRWWKRKGDRASTATGLTTAEDALASRTRQFEGAQEELANQRRVEDEQISQQGAPLLARRQQLMQAGGPREADPNFAMAPEPMPEEGRHAKDDSTANDVRKKVVDPFADDVRRAFHRAKAGRLDRKQQGLAVPNYGQSLLSLPEPDRDPRYLGITESKNQGGDAYADKVKEHAQRRMLKDIAKENPINLWDSLEEGRPKLRDAVEQQTAVQEALAQRSQGRLEPLNPADQASRSRLEAFEAGLNQRMGDYTDSRAQALTPIFEAAKKRKQEEKRQREWEKRQRELDLQEEREREEREQQRAAYAAKLKEMFPSSPDPLDAEDEGMAVPQITRAREKGSGFGGPNPRSLPPAGLDSMSHEALYAAEDSLQRNRPPQKLNVNIEDGHFGAYTSSDLEQERREAALKEGSNAVQGGGLMERILNDVTERNVKYNYDARRDYVQKNYIKEDQAEEMEGLVKPGANEDNLRRNYIDSDHFAANKAPEIDRSQDDFARYAGLRDLYKAHASDKKQKKAWQEASGGEIVRYKLAEGDALRTMKIPGKNETVKHGYRFQPFARRK